MKPASPILFASCLLVSFGLSALIHQSSQVAPAFLPIEPTNSTLCPPKLQFQVGYQRDTGGAFIQGQGVNFMGFSYVKAQVCSAGTLIVDGEGQLGGTELPRLDIALDNQSLGTSNFNKRKTVSFRVPHAGLLTIAYLNDYYLADVRIATLSQLRLTKSPCKNLSFDVPTGTGGSYNDKANVINLVAAVPMTIKPCAAGELSFLTTGRAGQKSFPQLRIQQGGKMLALVQTSATGQMTHLSVTADPITIMVVNPYGKQLADRNLLIHSVHFIPANSVAAP